ncbi:hypothetical protein B2J93_2322 [Marssonina coronariae]|uniref:Uncharacterized protein n=1 Tax=Diplocarpon coronariae TaxID=2795749 RepID=A0A218Z260_9HELO|nr:hypothetical protein B2J93_2322 [Marssonina coronariae]
MGALVHIPDLQQTLLFQLKLVTTSSVLAVAFTAFWVLSVAKLQRTRRAYPRGLSTDHNRRPPERVQAWHLGLCMPDSVLPGADARLNSVIFGPGMRPGRSFVPRGPTTSRHQSREGHGPAEDAPTPPAACVFWAPMA